MIHQVGTQGPETTFNTLAGNRAPAKRVVSEPVADALGDRQRSSAGVPRLRS